MDSKNQQNLITQTPEAEVDITPQLVFKLLHKQHQDLSHLPISSFAEGWDNQLYRLGEDYIVRLPRRAIGAELIMNEQKWLPQIASQLEFQTPKPIRIGRPQDNYPWTWSIVPWIDGQSADIDPPLKSEYHRYIKFLLNIHKPAPPEAPINKTRGISLNGKAEDTIARMDRLNQTTDHITGGIEEIWSMALREDYPKTGYWIHGDLHPKNIIVHEGRINGIIDWGDITSGDVATDLASIWMLFDDQNTRRHALNIYGADRGLIIRSMGWSIFFAVIFLEIGINEKSSFEGIGIRILERLKSDTNFCQ